VDDAGSVIAGEGGELVSDISGPADGSPAVVESADGCTDSGGALVSSAVVCSAKVWAGIEDDTDEGVALSVEEESHPPQIVSLGNQTTV
jgi:hypothetical protein